MSGSTYTHRYDHVQRRTRPCISSTAASSHSVAPGWAVPPPTPLPAARAQIRQTLSLSCEDIWRRVPICRADLAVREDGVATWGRFLACARESGGRSDVFDRRLLRSLFCRVGKKKHFGLPQRARRRRMKCPVEERSPPLGEKVRLDFPIAPLNPPRFPVRRIFRVYRQPRSCPGFSLTQIRERRHSHHVRSVTHRLAWHQM